MEISMNLKLTYIASSSSTFPILIVQAPLSTQIIFSIISREFSIPLKFVVCIPLLQKLCCRPLEKQDWIRIGKRKKEVLKIKIRKLSSKEG
jgi:hypothetical protein